MLVVRSKLESRQIIVSIGVQRFGQSDLRSVPDNGVGQFPIAAYSALIDTGAQRTCLTAKTIANERLTSHGKYPIRNVHNENLHRLYLVKLGFWCEGSEPGGHQESSRNYFGLDKIIEVINIADNDRFDAIIGMDVLQNFDFSFSNTGAFEIKLD